jgi:2-dehydropantoate 2-reductase
MDAALADGATITPIIGMPPVMSNHPHRYVDEIFDEVLKTFSKPDTLTTSLQDWRKGRRAEILEVNGHVTDVLKRHGKAAPVNDRIIKLARAIENGDLIAQPSNAGLLVQSSGLTGETGLR